MSRGNPKFQIGTIVVTPAAAAVLSTNNTSVDALLLRHQYGDWGDVSEPVRAVNERGLADSFNLQSKYTMADGRRLIVLTSRDRTTTMVHLDAM